MNYHNQARRDFADAARQAYNVPSPALTPQLQAWQAFRDEFVRDRQRGGLVTKNGERIAPGGQR